MKDMKILMKEWRQYEKQLLSEGIAEYIPGTSANKMKKAVDTSKDVDKETWVAQGRETLDQEVGDASTKDVVPLVKFLNSPEGKDPKVRAALAAGKEDGQPGDETIGVGEASPPVGKMIPTQNEISLAKSIGFPLSDTKTLKNVATGDPTGQGMKIVSSDNLVIDGHHRWSSTWSVCPECVINAVNIDLPGTKPLQKLASAQAAIVATIDPSSGDVPKATAGAGDNILGAGAPKIASMITKLAADGATMGSGLPLLGDEYIEAVKTMPEGQKYFGVDQSMDAQTARQTIIDKVSQNLANLPQPQGPPRDYMPQFDGGETHKGQVKLQQVINKMKSGEVNYKAPFEESIRRMVKEILNEKK